MGKAIIHPGHVIGFVLVSAFAAALSLARSVPNDQAAGNEPNEEILLAATLGDALGLQIRSEKIHFIGTEPPAGLKAAAMWSEVVFLGATHPAAPADLYRAEVRLNQNRGVLSVKGQRNLTATPAGDEFELAVAPPQAAVATRALGQVRSVSVFDFSKRPVSEGEEWSPITRFLARLTNLRKTGRLMGVKKTSLRFETPPTKASLAVEPMGGAMRIVVNEHGVNEKRVAIIGPDGHPASQAHLVVTEEMRVAKRPILWMVDTVRSFSFVGPGPIEWAEGRFFAFRDAARRFKYAVFGGNEWEELASTDGDDTPVEEAFHVPGGSEVGKTPNEVAWPPKPIAPPVFKRLAKGEGIWRPNVPDFIRRLPGAPSITYQTYTRPDIRRPYVRVFLIAMDMRQLELHMVGGYEDPESTTGSQGTGRIPRIPEILDNVVIAFNGAFKTLHGSYGMMVNRDVLLPPKEEAATVGSTEDGRVWVGSWPKETGIPKDMRSFRQNMDPVVEDGVVNPRRRYLWGFTLDEDITQMNTIRSGICLAENGSLIYAWGEDLTATTLGIAMKAGGCTYGIHLDMNPFHTSFIYYKFRDSPPGKRPEFDAELVFPEMRFSPNRYVNGAPKDFFFATLKNPTPGAGWEHEGLTQPAPGFVKAIHQKRAEECNLVSVDLSRTSVSIEPGELPTHLVPGSELIDKEDLSLMLVDLPIGRWSSTRGQVVSGAIVSDITDARATFAVDGDGIPILCVWPPVDRDGESVGDAVQCDWLGSGEPADDQNVTAAGLIKGRWLVLGEGTKSCLRDTFDREGVQDPVYFQTDGIQSGAAIRSIKGLVDLDGNPVKTRDAFTASIRVMANPVNLGASRLESHFGVTKGGDKAIEDAINE